MKTIAQRVAPGRSRRESIDSLGTEVRDLVIVGGGISGATLAWDAALRGLRVLLVERGDYASGTSQATSKLIHGGLRYLRNGEFRMVRQSLRERRLLAKNAPHAVRPEPFVFPIYRDQKPGRWITGLGLWLYDLLAFDRNRGLPPELRLPKTRWLSRPNALKEEPALDPEGLIGAYVYYDYANMNPERLCAEFIVSARALGAQARNYTSVELVDRERDDVYSIGLCDTITGEETRVRVRTVINACGPWADYLDRTVLGRIDHALVRSKGIHVITRKLIGERTIARIKPDGKHIFLIPWRNKTIIGTTDTEFQGHPDDLRVTVDDALGVIQDINVLFPRWNLGLDDVEYFYGGLRPLVDNGDSSTYNRSRRDEIRHHADAGYGGYFTVLGGKYTTSRHLAEKAIDAVVNYLGREAACETADTPLPGGDFSDMKSLVADLAGRFPGVATSFVQLLCERYGRSAQDVLERMRKGPRPMKLLNGEVYFPEEIDYLVETEDVCKMGDLYFRRSGLGTTGKPSRDLNRKIVERVAKTLGWTAKEKSAAMDEIEGRYSLAMPA